MADSCCIYGRTKLNKPSRLHKNLLGIVDRKTANELFFLSQNPKFEREYSEFLDEIRSSKDNEALLAPFVLLVSDAGYDMSTINDEDFVRVVAKSFLQDENPEYSTLNYYSLSSHGNPETSIDCGSFENAMDLANKFNKKNFGGDLFCAIVEGEGIVKIVLNTNEATKRQLKFLELREVLQELAPILEAHGIAVLSHEDAKDTRNNAPDSVEAIIEYSVLGNVTLNKYQAVGEGFVLMLKDNKLLERLINVIKQNPAEIASLLDMDVHDLLKLSLSKQAGLLVAKYLGEAKAYRESSAFQKFKSYIVRGLNWIKTMLNINTREFSRIKYNAARKSFELAKHILDANFRNFSYEGISNRNDVVRKVSSSTLNLIDNVNAALRELSLMAERFKTQPTDVFKAFNKLFNNTFNLYKTAESALKENLETFGDESPFNENNALVKLLQSFNNIVANLIENMNISKTKLLIVINDYDANTTEAPTLKLCADACYQNQEMYNLARQLLESWRLIKNTLRVGSVAAGTISLKMLLAETEEFMLKLLKLMVNANDRAEGYDALIRDARRKTALKLLKEINGDEFVAIAQHVFYKSKSLRDLGIENLIHLKASIINLELELIKTDVNPPFQWASRWIYSMADSPDIINQMVYDIINRLKFQGDLLTLEHKNWLLNWYHKVRAAGIDNTRLFYEYLDDGTLSGNLLSERHWGKWEKAYQEEKAAFEEIFYREHIADGSIRSRSEMYHMLQYLVEFSKFRQEWHKRNSKYVLLTNEDGSYKLDEDGGVIKVLVPITSDDEDFDSSKHNDYKNEAYDNLTEELKKLLKEYVTFKRDNLDSKLPSGATNPFGLRAPQFVNRTTRVISNAIRADLSGKRIGRAFMRRFWTYNWNVNPDDMEFGAENNTYGEDELYDANRNAIFDSAQANAISLIDRLPMYGVKKLPDMIDLSTDLTSSTIAYASMANRYGTLNDVVGAVCQLRDLISERSVNTKAGSMTIESLARHGKTPLHYERLKDYLLNQVFNNYSDKSNSNAYKRLRRFSNFIANFGSWYLLHDNWTSAITNALTGFSEMFKEAWGGDLFTMKDFMWALGMFTGIWTSSFIRKLANFAHISDLLNIKNEGKTGSLIEEHNKGALFIRTFDTLNANEREFRSYKIETIGSGITGGNNIFELQMLPYTITDKWMQSIAFLGSAKHIKLRNKKTGEHVSLWDAYEVQGERVVPKGGYDLWEILDRQKLIVIDTIAEKVLNKQSLNYQDLAFNLLSLSEQKAAFVQFGDGFKNGDGEYVRKSAYVDWDVKLENKFRIKCRSLNNRMHGVYNRDDAGAFMNLPFGAALASLKKYAIGLIDNRFSTLRVDYRTGDVRLGRYMTAIDLMIDCVISSVQNGKETETLHGMRNVIRFIKGIIDGALTILTGGMYNNKFLKRYYSPVLIANILKLTMDWLIPFLQELTMVLLAPPDEEEKNKDHWFWGLFGNVRNEVDSLFKPISDLMLDVYVEYLNLSPIPITVSDKELLTKDAIREAVLKETGTEPFSMSGILYYQTYRTLMEQQAYNPISPASMYGEFKGLTSNSIPGLSAIRDFIELLSESQDSKHIDDLTDEDKHYYLIDKGSRNEHFYNLPEFMYDDKRARSTKDRGRQQWYYKYQAHGLKIGPLRSFEHWINGYKSKENSEYFRNMNISK